MFHAGGSGGGESKQANEKGGVHKFMRDNARDDANVNKRSGFLILVYQIELVLVSFLYMRMSPVFCNFKDGSCWSLLR